MMEFKTGMKLVLIAADNALHAVSKHAKRFLNLYSMIYISSITIKSITGKICFKVAQNILEKYFFDGLITLFVFNLISIQTRFERQESYLYWNCLAATLSLLYSFFYVNVTPTLHGVV